METLEILKNRHSVRKYKPDPVEDEKLEKILAAAHYAPTAANLQPVRLIVVKTPEGWEKLNKGSRLYGAPVAVIVCASKNTAWKRKYDDMNTYHIDASILTDHMMIEATSLGLGTLWACWFNPEVIRTEFTIPEDYEPINILAIGYADDEAPAADRHETQRIPLSELVHYEKF